MAASSRLWSVIKTIESAQRANARPTRHDSCQPASFSVGETNEAHQELVQFCQNFPFQRMGAFTYSEEDGTPAADYKDKVRIVPLSSRTSRMMCIAQVCVFAATEILLLEESHAVH